MLCMRYIRTMTTNVLRIRHLQTQIEWMTKNIVRFVSLSLMLAPPCHRIKRRNVFSSNEMFSLSKKASLSLNFEMLHFDIMCSWHLLMCGFLTKFDTQALCKMYERSKRKCTTWTKPKIHTHTHMSVQAFILTVQSTH